MHHGDATDDTVNIELWQNTLLVVGWVLSDTGWLCSIPRWCLACQGLYSGEGGESPIRSVVV